MGLFILVVTKFNSTKTHIWSRTQLFTDFYSPQKSSMGTISCSCLFFSKNTVAYCYFSKQISVEKKITFVCCKKCFSLPTAYP